MEGQWIFWPSTGFGQKRICIYLIYSFNTVHLSICTWILKFLIWKIEFEELDFLSRLNCIFAGFTSSKIQFKLEKNQVCWTWFFKLEISKLKCRPIGVWGLWGQHMNAFNSIKLHVLTCIKSSKYYRVVNMNILFRYYCIRASIYKLNMTKWKYLVRICYFSWRIRCSFTYLWYQKCWY